MIPGCEEHRDDSVRPIGQAKLSRNGPAISRGRDQVRIFVD
jgi:hypothetical protein